VNNSNPIRKRQSEVSKRGRAVEKKVAELLLDDEEIRERCIVARGPTSLLNAANQTCTARLSDYFTEENVEIDVSELTVSYKKLDGSETRELMDADIVVLDKESRRILCVISVKNSLRERGGQTAYWAVKSSKRCFKYIFVTPDKDHELCDENSKPKDNKWLTILTSEMDAVFVLKESGACIENGNFYVGNECLRKYIKTLLNNQDSDCQKL